MVSFCTGSDKYYGAVLLGITAALNTGVGYVMFQSDNAKLRDFVTSNRPEAVVSISNRLPSKAKVFVYGSGWDRFYPDKIHSINNDEIAILDAKAMEYVFRTNVGKFADNVIMTPHIGELVSLLNLHARISGSSTLFSGADIKGNPEQYAKMLYDLTNATVLLKGHENIIVNSSGVSRVVSNAHNLSQAGTGDVLAGILGGIFAIKLAGKLLSSSETDPRLDASEIRLVTALCTEIHSKSAHDAAMLKGHPLAPVTALEVAGGVSNVIWQWFE